jgi:hypothetical protein
MKKPMDVIDQAREFAVNAHSRIDHRRKYTKQPYSVHLSAVAKLVATVTDDPAPIAAAWLHDVVEDTTVTLLDLEAAFGKTISTMVDELTDISKPGDGNRAVRKKNDLEHLARASPSGQTVKLADLIDNCIDISKNDPRFARVYLKEMADLLEVLTDGDGGLYQKARKTHARCSEQIEESIRDETAPKESVGFLYRRLGAHSRMSRLIMKTFTALDIAEPLRSFDINEPCSRVLEIMEELDLNLVCLREQGKASGYVLRKDLGGKGICGDNLRPFRSGQIIQDDSPLTGVVHVLGLHHYAFVQTLRDVGGYISRNEANKPEFRMWLFGILTFVEMEITNSIKQQYTDDSWQSLVGESRLQKALELQSERQRRGEQCDLIDCLQYSEKARILLKNDDIMAEMRLDSKRMVKQLLKEVDSLRNNLAHSQDIGNHNWDMISRMSYNLEYDANLEVSG